tara:strand:- start:19251 stop:20381 length:1131 start_codon:yes stop_codon:yes gene_type:complete
LKERIAIISFSEIVNDSRVKRQINSLKDNYEIICFGYGKNYIQEITFIRLKERNNLFLKIYYFLLLICRKYFLYTSTRFNYSKIIDYVKINNIKFFILNDSTTWPLINLLKTYENCIIDAHEYTPEELTNNYLWKIIYKDYKLWCSNFAKSGGAHFTVEENLCKKWDIFTSKKFQLLRNTCYFYKNNYQFKRINSNKFNYIHHGLATPSRKLEEMILATGLAGDNFRGTFYLTGNDYKYKKYLKELAINNYCNIKNPIQESELVEIGTYYDFALLSIYPTNINYKYCLPNKFFQFIQSRLPIISGPTPSISYLIDKYKIGIVAKSFLAKDIALAMKKLNTNNIKTFKLNCEIAAKELCWEKEQKILTDTIKEIIKN